MDDSRARTENAQHEPGAIYHTRKKINQRLFRVVSKGFRSQFKQMGQRWDNLSINKDNTYNGLNHIKYV